MMRLKFAALLLISLVGLPVFAQENPPPARAQESHGADSHGIPITDPAKFFTDFFGVEWPKKTQFETDDEFKKRLPVYEGGSVYFVVEPMVYFENGKGVVKDEPFVYDLKKQKLTIRGGGKGFSEGTSTGGNLFAIKTVSKAIEPYEASNSFGVKATVSGILYQQYVINILNEKRIDKKYIKLEDKRRLNYVFENIPREKAREIAADVEFVIKVSPGDYPSRSYARSVFKKPTIQSPIKEDSVEWIIKADIEAIILRRKSTGAVEWQISVPKQ